MTTLVRTHEHLAAHRRQILVRSLFSGLIGMAPVPILDDWLVAIVRRGTIAKVAEARRVDLDPEALRLIADGNDAPPTWKQLLSASIIPLLLKQTFRKAVILLSAARRADDVLNTFAVATLFDHYCAQLHVGAGIDAERARHIRAQIDQVLAGASSKVALRIFRRALSAGGRAALRAPAELLDAASFGMLGKLLRKKAGGEAEAVEAVDEAIEKADKGFLARVAAAVDANLSTIGREYLNEIVDRLDTRWRA